MLKQQDFLLAAMMLWLLAGCASTEQKPVKDETQAYDQASISSVERDLEEGRIDLAILELEPLLQKDPDSAHLNALAGQAYARSGDMEKAGWYYEKAMQLTPDDPQLQLNYGVFLCQQKQYVAADNNFLKAIRNPENPYRDIALVNAGICARKAGDLPRAERYFNAALQVNPKSGVALYQLARLSMMVNNPAQARTFMVRYEAIAEPTPKTLLLSTLIGDELRDYNFASQASDQLLERFPRSPEADSLAAGTGREYIGLPSKTQPEEIPAVINEGVLSSMLVSESPAAMETGTVAEKQQTQVAKTAAEELPGMAWIVEQPADHYTLQLSASANMNSLVVLGDRLALQEYGIFRFERSGREMYALLSGSYADAQQARDAATGLKAQGYKDEPWIRRFDAIHGLMQGAAP